jgi:hypothetical protein
MAWHTVLRAILWPHPSPITVLFRSSFRRSQSTLTPECSGHESYDSKSFGRYADIYRSIHARCHNSCIGGSCVYSSIFHCPMRDEARILGFTDLMALGYLLYMSVLHELEITIFCSTSCTSLPPLRLSCVRKDLHNLLDSIRCTSERL